MERRKILLDLRVLTKKMGNTTNKDRIVIFLFYFITKEQSDLDIHVVRKTISFKSKKGKINLGLIEMRTRNK